MSHQGRLGTSRPRHYYVLYDDSRFESDLIETFTHALAFNYGRSTCAVSMPAPLFYADLLATRGMLYLDSIMSDDNASSVSGYTHTSDTLAQDDAKWAELCANYHPVHQSMQDKMFWV